MKLNRRLNQLSEGEYQHVLANHRRYTDFNSLGLFRSILENERLDLARQLRVRDAAVAEFPKFFEFLQLKDPGTYLRLNALGREQTVADERAAWEQVRRNQQRLLAEKGIRHRSIGVYVRHDCGYDWCPYNGIMVRPGTWLAERGMHFVSDNHHWAQAEKSRQRRQERKSFRRHRNNRLPDEL